MRREWQTLEDLCVVRHIHDSQYRLLVSTAATLTLHQCISFVSLLVPLVTMRCLSRECILCYGLPNCSINARKLKPGLDTHDGSCVCFIFLHIL